MLLDLFRLVLLFPKLWGVVFLKTILISWSLQPSTVLCCHWCLLLSCVCCVTHLSPPTRVACFWLHILFFYHITLQNNHLHYTSCVCMYMYFIHFSSLNNFTNLKCKIELRQHLKKTVGILTTYLRKKTYMYIGQTKTLGPLHV